VSRGTIAPGDTLLLDRPWETCITVGNVPIMLVISVSREDLTSEICSGAHISRGNIYHCNTGLLPHRFSIAFACDHARGSVLYLGIAKGTYHGYGCTKKLQTPNQACRENDTA